MRSWQLRPARRAARCRRHRPRRRRATVAPPVTPTATMWLARSLPGRGRALSSSPAPEESDTIGRARPPLPATPNGRQVALQVVRCHSC